MTHSQKNNSPIVSIDLLKNELIEEQKKTASEISEEQDWKQAINILSNYHLGLIQNILSWIFIPMFHSEIKDLFKKRNTINNAVYLKQIINSPPPHKSKQEHEKEIVNIIDNLRKTKRNRAQSLIRQCRILID